MTGFTSIGDLARNFQTSLQSNRTKTDLKRLSEELASGRKSETARTLSRDYLPLAGIERSLGAIAAYETASSEAQTYTATMQASLTKIEIHQSQLGPALLTAGNAQSATMVTSVAADAATRFDAVIDAINIRVADRTAFAGAAVDGPALADARTILNDLLMAVAGLADAASIDAAVTQWFDQPGGGYETVGYLGSQNTLAEFRISDGEAVSLTATAMDQDFRDVLKGFALAALIDEGVLSGSITEQARLTQRAGEYVMASSDSLTRIQARIGVAEARIDYAATSMAAMKHALEFSRLNIIQADPYETATALEQTRAQLENIYVVTARLSQLALTEYLR